MMTPARHRRFKLEAEEALRHWSDNIKGMLAGRYGKGEVGHILILFPFGNDTSATWISDATRPGVARMLRKLADHLDDRRVILPGDDRFDLQ